MPLTVALVCCVDEVLEYGALQDHPRLVALTTLVSPSCTQLLCCNTTTVFHRLHPASQLQLVHLADGLQQCRARGVLMQLLVETSRLNEEESRFASTASLQTMQRRVDAQLDLLQRG